MATMAASRKTIHDYPEHLNPFHEDDNHNKIRFWTLGKKLQRSNSITFSGIKDLKNSWAFRSFMKKGKKTPQESPSQNGDSSPIVYRRAMQYSQTSSTLGQRSTVGSPERYVYGGSITPLPRSRFQERLRSSSQYDETSLNLTPRMARSEVSGSRLSVESTNPFEEGPVAPITSETSELQISEVEDKTETKAEGDLDLEEMNLSIELKIVEDEDEKNKTQTMRITEVSNEAQTNKTTVNGGLKINNNTDVELRHVETLNIEEEPVKAADSEEDILNSVSFPKVNIVQYRRNSSVNDDDIRLRRGNLEDFHSLSNKRSKSLNNSLDTTYLTYDINLNENTTIDTNGNEEPQKVVCKLYDEAVRKQSIDTVSSTEKEFMEIDRATRELEREISKLNSALNEDDLPGPEDRLSVSEIKRRFDKNGASSPNPIPKPRRSHYGGSNSP
ncbi:hypothetical protein OBRU01_13301 [Operophtera brumata]|uniref:Uncharacterized protein n=1 Tax=Operophtera brumata TaxID=104452 RepID=A0A0L7L8H0_OPEBR|nr:hypothetical protein OBRU01_13301 [Operophtera brumata]